MPYDISSRAYLVRARTRLNENTHEALFYAALELRCGIEARMTQYLEVWDHISEKKKKGWQIAKLGRNLEEAFASNTKIVRWGVRDRDSGEPTVSFYYTPVTEALQKDGEKLGNHLHSMKEFRSTENKYWEELRSELETVSGRLKTANVGTLLGPPLVRAGTKLADTRLELPPGFELDDLTKKMTDRPIIIDVSYHDNVPEKFEPEAVVWVFRE